MLKQSEKRIVSFARIYQKYCFYKRNKWLYYIPFNQLSYKWIIDSGKDTDKDLQIELELHKILLTQKAGK